MIHSSQQKHLNTSSILQNTIHMQQLLNLGIHYYRIQQMKRTCHHLSSTLIYKSYRFQNLFKSRSSIYHCIEHIWPHFPMIWHNRVDKLLSKKIQYYSNNIVNLQQCPPNKKDIHIVLGRNKFCIHFNILCKFQLKHHYSSESYLSNQLCKYSNHRIQNRSTHNYKNSILYLSCCKFCTYSCTSYSFQMYHNKQMDISSYKLKFNCTDNMCPCIVNSC